MLTGRVKAALSNLFNPGVRSMWVRQCDLDAETDFLPPIPSRIASNEEFVPPPQSAEQNEYEDAAGRAQRTDRPAAGPLAARFPAQRQWHGGGPAWP